MRIAILVAMLVAPACAHGVAPRPPSLDDLLAFSDPALCEPAPRHARMLAAMVAGDANSGFKAGRLDVPSAYSRAFDAVRIERHEHHVVIGVGVRGTLFGLPLIAIEQSLPEGGDPGFIHFRFKARADEVARALAARGFPARVGQAVPLGQPDGYEHVLELLADPHHPGHSLLSCGYQ